MRARGFTHVSIHAYDLEESLRFYVDVLGMRRVPSPDFAQQVEWLEIGGQQLHLFQSDGPAPANHHIGIDVDDFEAAYRMATERGLLDERTFGAAVRELNDGAVQLYLRDPAGNLVELNWPDVTTLDQSIVTDIRRLADERPQSEEALRAKLYMARAGAVAAASAPN